MLVYANYLKFVGADAEQAILKAVGAWIKEQIGYGLHPDQLQQDGVYKGNRNGVPSSVQIRTAATEKPTFYTWVLRNSDDNVIGREWICEVGLKSGDEQSLSITLKSEERSTRVGATIVASRPRLVKYALRNIADAAEAALAKTIPGAFLKTIGESKDSYRALRVEVDRRDRKFPIVLVSPDAYGEYLIDPEPLREVLVGLAEVVQIEADFDSYEMKEVLGSHWSAWSGAVNLIYPPQISGFARGHPFRSLDIESWGDSQHERRTELLGWVTNITNIPLLHQRIRPEGVAQLALQRRFTALRKHVADLDDSVLRKEFRTLETLAEEQSDQISGLERERQDLEGEIEKWELEYLRVEESLSEARKQISKKEYEIQAMRDSLAKGGGGRSTIFDAGRLLGIACRAGEPTPHESLEVIEGLFGDKCLILESAFSSALELNMFCFGRRLLDMLRLLVTDYRDALMEGGDNTARKVFGKNEYAAKESETVMSSPDMRRRRTFEYLGKKVEMFRHLKIGVDDDLRKTIRVHFHWDAVAEKIIIGYCGKHLPVPSH
ncbi:hypothetical protein [Thiocapsa roseopersicina]|uniref:Uncharacterized protein n=1 Tax=Thiocapsa roseopersicina TaxID=1058 RepID=A0A1H3DH56_THIRO|nr:hypothetical protein [Thiocapsa roseopersicina]SDX65701.1 hypothetical protein SAMN05421783_14912 [Thiocapsa roseopersicina]